MDQGIYLLRFRFNGTSYARKVLVDDGGYYRFVDEFNAPLPDSLPLSVEVSKASGSEFVTLCCINPLDEEIHWNDAQQTTPDDGIVVMVKAPYASEPVWSAYLEDNTWFYMDGSRVGEDVYFWADWPVGPACDEGDEDGQSGVTADLPPRQPLLNNSVAMALRAAPQASIGFGEGLR